MNSRTLVVLAALSLAPTGPAAATPQERGRVVCETLAGELESLTLEGFELVSLAARDVVFLRFEGLQPTQPSSAAADRATVGIEGGDRLHGAVHGGEGDLLELELLSGALLVLEVDRVRSVVFSARLSAEVLAGVEPAQSGDILYWLRPGGNLDHVPGTLLEFTLEGPRMEGSFGERTFPWSEVAALFVEPLGEAPPAPPDELAPGLRPGARAVLDLVDGGRLRGTLTRLAEGGCLLEYAAGRHVALPLAAVAEIVADDGRLRFLSELAPARVDEGSPFGDDLGLVWHHRIDLSVTGAPLRAGGRVWRRGIGVHAPSRLTYALDGEWSELRGSCAIDDQVLMLSARGSVLFRVLVDGEERWKSAVVRAGDPPISLPSIALDGATELVLEADMSTDFHVGDRADWLRPLLVRAR